MARWIFDDALGTTYSFAVNPNEMSSPWFDNNVQASPTVAPDGGFILTEGPRAAKELTLSGVILAQAQYVEMVAWLKQRKRVYLTDHFNRRMIVFVRTFEPTPLRRTTWKHSYSMTLIVLTEPVQQ